MINHILFQYLRRPFVKGLEKLTVVAQADDLLGAAAVIASDVLDVVAEGRDIGDSCL